MDYKELLEIEYSKSQERESLFHTYSQKAIALDLLLPAFFEYAVSEYNDYLSKEIETAKGKKQAELHPNSYCEYLDIEWFNLLKKYYPVIVMTINLEDLYYLQSLIDLFFLREYMHISRDSYYPSKSTFSEMLNKNSDYFDKFIGYDEDEDTEGAEEEKWILKEDTDYYYEGRVKDDNYIKKYRGKDDEIIYRESIYSDYSEKKESLFIAIGKPDVSSHIRKKWSADFVELSELILQGKYLQNEKIITISELKNNGDSPFFGEPEVLLGEVLSFRSCYIFFVNYVEQRNKQSFNSFVRFVNATCMNIIEKHYLRESDDEKTIEELLKELYEHVNGLFAECKRTNIYGLYLNCFPKYYNTALLSIIPRLRELTNGYYAEVIAPHTEVITEMDVACKNLAIMLLREGYEREDLREYIQSYQRKIEEQDKYVYVYNKLYELGLIQELLYLVSDAISLNDELSENIPSYKRLCAQIQDYLYQDYGYQKIEKELEAISSHGIELISLSNQVQTHQKYLYYLNAMLDSDKTMEEILNIRSSLFSQIFNEGINPETSACLMEINQKVMSYIEYKTSQEQLYGDIASKVETKLNQYIPTIKKKINDYLGSSKIDLDSIFELLERKLTTAELLYQRYVHPFTSVDISALPEEIAEMDFSYLALEYYTALELLANALLYAPYREKVLLPAYEKYGSELFDRTKEGYLGFIKKPFIVSREKIKESLELGTISFFYRNALKGGSGIKAEFTRIAEYIQTMSLSMNEACEFGRKLFEIKDLRNESAHGGNNLDINKARKAQDVSYIHLPKKDQLCRINIADQCHAEIINLLKWFSNKPEDKQL